MQFTEVSILVTGASGLVGSRVAARLAGLGAKVRAIVRKRGDHHGLDHGNITQIEGDFTDGATTASAAGDSEYVVHCAATVGKDLEDARRVNVAGTQSVCAAARDAGCRRMVHVSTCSVYEREARLHVDEDSPLKTTGDNYSVTKAGAERALEPFMERGLNVAIVRPTAILGFHPSSSWAVKVPARIREGKLPLRIDGSDSLGFVHVENLVDAILLAMEHPAAAGRAFNAVDGMITWKAYAEEVRGWFPGCPPLPVIPADQVPADAFWKGTFSSERIRRELGYVAQRSYADGMAEAAAHWRNHG